MAEIKPTPKPGSKNDKAKESPGLRHHLRPMNDNNSIFADLTRNAMRLDLGKVLDHQGDRPLKIATMCSGTEAPILVMGCVNKALKGQNARPLNFEHMFSAEIEYFKQGYIERNFKPRILFRDVRELDQEKAYSAYGAKERVPGWADMLVVGSSCVDYSTLNTQKPTTGGESQDTFGAAVAYAKKHRCRMVVMENVIGAPYRDMVNAWMEAGYYAVYKKVDTKDYYLPQTRERGYLVAFDKALLEAAELDTKTLGDKWIDLMTKFERPASSDVSEFLFDEDDPCIQDERRDVLRGSAKSGNVAWVKSQALHVNFRIVKGLGSKRPYTDWKNGGSHRAPDYWWAPWLKRQSDRILDCLEMNYLLGIEMGRDMSYVARFLDLSQNIDREQHYRTSGLIGCITPAGILCSTVRGGPILGREALNLQGLPVREMLFTRETSKQLKDLAGHAMSAPVVGAAMLSALIVAHKTLPKGQREENIPVKGLNDNSTSCQWEQVSPLKSKADLGIPRSKSLTVKELIDYVIRAKGLCSCESSTLFKPGKFLRCKQCLHTVCVSCHGNPTHDFEEIDKQATDHRTPYAKCRDEIQGALPMRLTFNVPSDWDVSVIGDEAWEESRVSIRECLKDELRFHWVKRGLKWTVDYRSRHGRLELSIAEGGVQWLMFASVPEAEPAKSKVRDILSQPFARMTPRGKHVLDGVWEFNGRLSKIFELNITGRGTQIDCLQVRLGLENAKYQGRKVYTKLLVDCPHDVEQELGTGISGEYEYLEHCGTAMNSLYRQISQGKGQAVAEQEAFQPVTKEQAVFLFFDQDELGLSDADSFVFAKDHRGRNRGNSRQVLARVDNKFDVYQITSDKEPNVVNCCTSGRWQTCEQASLTPVVDAAGAIYSFPSGDMAVDVGFGHCASNYVPIFECSAPVNSSGSKPNVQSLPWLTERARQDVALGAFKDWITTARLPKCGRCEICAPRRAKINCRRNAKGDLILYEDERQMAEFERRYKGRPSPVTVKVLNPNEDCTKVKIYLNFATLIHRAMASLPNVTPETDINNVSCYWRLVTGVTPLYSHPAAKFTILDNNSTKPLGGTYGFVKGKALRPEQLREYTWAKCMDQEGAAVEEEEVEEAHVESMGWRGEGRVVVQRRYYGGVLASNVGFGKTLIILALIGATRNEDEKFRPEQNVKGAIRLRATLILVPGNLVTQWATEITSFLGTSIKVLPVRNDNAWAKLTFKDIEEADIVLMSWNLLMTQTTDKLLRKVQAFTARSRPPWNQKSNDRAKTQWFTEAMIELEDSVEKLKEGGPPGLSKHLNEKLSKPKDDNDDGEFVPSKRVRGKKYQLKLSSASTSAIHSASTSTPDLPIPFTPSSSTKSLQREETVDTPMSDAPALAATTVKSQKEQSKGEAALSNVNSSPISDFLVLTKKVLSGECKRQGVQGYSRWNKTELAQKLLDKGIHARSILPPEPSSKKRTSSDAFEPDCNPTQDLVASLDEEPELEEMANLPMHMFYWDRVVIDEFMYLAKKYGCLIPWIKSRSRFILSATPSLQTFADIRLLANLLGIHLGVEDDDDLAGSSTERAPTLSTAVASAIQELGTSTELRLRRSFLTDLSERYQNEPEHDEIKREEHIIAGTLTSSQKPVYIELTQQLALQDLEMPLRQLPTTALENDRLDRFNVLIGKHSTAQEALMHGASDFTVCSEDVPPNATEAWKAVVQSRKAQQKECEKTLRTFFRKAVWLANLPLDEVDRKGGPSAQQESFQNFKNELDVGNSWDDPVVSELRRLFQEAETQTSANDGAQFYQTKAEQKAKVRKAAEEAIEAAEEEAKAAQEAVKAAEEEAEAAEEKAEVEVDEEDVKKSNTTPSEEEKKKPQKKKMKKIGFEIQKVLPTTAKAIFKELTDVTSLLRTYSKEYECLTRGQRFFERYGACRDWMANNGGQPHCDSCETPASPASTKVLVSCGHVVCQYCLKKHRDDGTCPVVGCKVDVCDSEMIEVEDLGKHDDPLDMEYGSKIGNLIRLLRGDVGGESKIESDHQVLLFVQSNIMKGKVIGALKEKNLSHAVLGARGQGIGPFLNYKPPEFKVDGQVETADSGAKVLILEVDNEKAAGLNLTKARHVVFLAPLLSDSQQHYEAQMKQAIGRACRYGQTNLVHIHRLISLNTIEVNVLEQREGKTLVEREGKFLLVDRREPDDGGPWSSRSLDLDGAEEIVGTDEEMW